MKNTEELLKTIQELNDKSQIIINELFYKLEEKCFLKEISKQKLTKVFSSLCNKSFKGKIDELNNMYRDFNNEYKNHKDKTDELEKIVYQVVNNILFFKKTEKILSIEQEDHPAKNLTNWCFWVVENSIINNEYIFDKFFAIKNLCSEYSQVINEILYKTIIKIMEDAKKTLELKKIVLPKLVDKITDLNNENNLNSNKNLLFMSIEYNYPFFTITYR